MTSPREPWSEQRVTAAFTARAAIAGPSPGPLVDDTVARLQVLASRPRPRSGWDLHIAASIAAVVVVATVVGLTPSVLRAPVRGSPAAPAAIAASATAPAPLPVASQSPETTILEPITVSEALRLRDDRPELAVAGFLSPSAAPFCPMFDASARCGVQWLMERRETTSTESTIGKPTGPAFRTIFYAVDSPIGPPTATGNEPLEVVLLGHFVPDLTGRICVTRLVPDPADPCEPTFEVDQVRSIRGQDQPIPTVDRRGTVDASGKRIRAEPKRSAETIDQVVAATSKGEQILARALITGAQASKLDSGEQDRPQNAAILLIGEPIVWFVTTLGSDGRQPAAHRWLVADRSSNVARITDDGRVLMALPTSRPDQTIVCGRFDLDMCAATLALVRADDAAHVDTAWKIVVDDTCPPPAMCDRLYPFDSVVVLVDEPTKIAPWTAYSVVGLTDSPQRVILWSGQLPKHVLDMIVPVVAIPPQSPGAS